MAGTRLLKKDLFGEVSLRSGAGGDTIVRDAAAARWPVRWLARRLLRREARMLGRLEGLAGVPRIVSVTRDRLERSYLEGAPMQEARPRDPAWFGQARRRLCRLHRRRIVHNDLAKEPNILVLRDGRPAFVDFQLAIAFRRRGRLFRTLAREDLRHLLKHKRTYCAHALTARERNMLATPALPARLWRRTVKPVYLLVTRRLLGWADREGAADRGRRP